MTALSLVKGPFKTQQISNLLWALAKLVDNGRLQLGSGQPGQPGVTALLPQVVTPPGPFKLLKEISTCCGRWRNWWRTGCSIWIRASLASQAVTALLPQVVTPPGPFKPQEISNLLWALAKLVENGLLHLDQGELASQAVTALLPQVVNPQGPISSSQAYLQPAVGAGETG